MAGMLEGKVVAVTGAGRGIGREIALLCAKEGASVLVNDLGASADGEGVDAGPAEEVAGLIRQAGGKAAVNGASVADPAAAVSIFEDAVKAFGRIYGVVNNAGILRDRIFHRLSEVDWRQVIDVHLHGAFLVSKAAAAQILHGLCTFGVAGRALVAGVCGGDATRVKRTRASPAPSIPARP